jgi:hypothetical protein
MQKYLIHIANDYADSVPLVASFIRMTERSEARGTTKACVYQTRNEVAEMIGDAIMEPCVECSCPSEDSEILIELEVEDSICKCTVRSICGECVQDLAGIISMAEFQGVVTAKERSFQH